MIALKQSKFWPDGPNNITKRTGKKGKPRAPVQKEFLKSEFLKFHRLSRNPKYGRRVKNFTPHPSHTQLCMGDRHSPLEWGFLKCDLPI